MTVSKQRQRGVGDACRQAAFALLILAVAALVLAPIFAATAPGR